MNIDDDTFYKNIEKRFYLKNAVNYFIFINLLRATDNEGKNIFMLNIIKTVHIFTFPGI